MKTKFYDNNTLSLCHNTGIVTRFLNDRFPAWFGIFERWSAKFDNYRLFSVGLPTTSWIFPQCI